MHYFWYRSRQCSSVPSEPERLRWPSNGVPHLWHEFATPLLRRDCVLAMQYISAHGPADDRMRHYHDMPLAKLSNIAKNIDYDIMWDTTTLDSLLPKISILDEAATSFLSGVSIPHPFDERRRTTILTDPIGTALWTLRRLLRAREINGDHRVMYQRGDEIDVNVLREHDARMADWEESFNHDIFFGDPHSWPDGRDSPPPSPTSPAYSPSSPPPEFSPTTATSMSYLSSATNSDALGDDTGPSDDDGGSLETAPAQVYPPADVPHAEDRRQPPDHGSPYSSDSDGEGSMVSVCWCVGYSGRGRWMPFSARVSR